MDDQGNRDFEDVYEEWLRIAHAHVSKDSFEKLTHTINTAISPLKPLLGLFAFTAYDPAHLWGDNADVFLAAWPGMVTTHYPDSDSEIPLLFIGFHQASRFGSNREPWGLFLTDAAAYASVDLYGGKAPRRYAHPSLDAASAGWASTFAEKLVADFDPKGIAQFVKLSTATPDYDSVDNPEHRALVAISSPEQMAETIRAALTLALDALAAAPGSLRHVDAASGEEPEPQAERAPEPVALSRRILELGLSEYIKLGTDARQAKHFKKFAAKLGMPSEEKILFSFSDSTFAGIYGLVVTDRAIWSRDLMEDPVSQPLDAGGDIVSNDKEHTLVIGEGPVHHIGEFVPERLMPSVAALLDECLKGRILFT